jgi:hypothetical protein
MSYSDTRTKKIGKIGQEHVGKFLREHKHAEAIQVSEANRDAICKQVQIENGDYLIKNWPQRGSSHWLEVKTEEKHTGNLFLEIWSNFNFKFQRTGWMEYSKTDLIVFYFLFARKAYLFDFARLWQWAWTTPSINDRESRERVPRIFCGKFPIVAQRKTEQINLTIGALVDIDDIRDPSLAGFMDEWDLSIVSPIPAKSPSDGYVPVNSKSRQITLF